MTTAPPDDLEVRIAGFARLGLYKIAAALVTDDRPAALLVGEKVGALPMARGVDDDLMAGAFETLASMAQAEAAGLRGEQATR